MEQKDIQESGNTEGIEVQINNIQLQENVNKEIEKIIFGTSKGDITWKPKGKLKVFEGGFEVVKPSKIFKEDLPPIMKEMAGLIRDYNKIKVLVSYNYMITLKDGSPVTYRFLLSEKTLEKWKIIKEDIKQENVI